MKRSKANANPTKFSKDVLLLNSALFQPSGRPIAEPESPAVTSKAGNKGHTATRGKKRREMNATEREFSRFLDARMRSGRIVGFEYEGLTLRWGQREQFRYTPDFLVFESIMPSHLMEDEIPHVRITLIEIKGAHCWKDGLLRYRMAKNEWPLFGFEFWQKTSNGWEMTR